MARLNLLVQPSHLAVEVLRRSNKRPQQRRQRLVVQRLRDQGLKGRAGELRRLQPFHLQDGPDGVARVERLLPELLTYRQQGAVALSGHRLHRHGAEHVDPHQVRNATRVVLVGLVAEPRLERGGGVGRIDDDHRQPSFQQPPRNPGGVDARLKADPFDLLPACPDSRGDRLRRACHGLRTDHLAGRVHEAHRRARDRNVQTNVEHACS